MACLMYVLLIYCSHFRKLCSNLYETSIKHFERERDSLPPSLVKSKITFVKPQLQQHSDFTFMIQTCASKQISQSGLQ